MAMPAAQPPTIEKAALSRNERLMWGFDLDSWNVFLVWSLAGAALAAFAVVISTVAVIRLQKAAELATKNEFDRYKIQAGERVALLENKTADATARQKEAELKLAQLRKLVGPRSINFDVFKKELEGKPKALVAIWYVPESSDGYWFASRLFTALSTAGWQAAWPATIPELKPEDVEMIVPNSAQLFSILQGMPRPMLAGGQPSGVTVVSDNVNADISSDAPMTPYKALFQALGKSTDFGIYGSGASQFMPVPAGTLRVVIAAKTDPIFNDNPPNAATANPR